MRFAENVAWLRPCFEVRDVSVCQVWLRVVMPSSTVVGSIEIALDGLTARNAFERTMECEQDISEIA